MLINIGLIKFNPLKNCISSINHFRLFLNYLNVLMKILLIMLNIITVRISIKFF